MVADSHKLAMALGRKILKDGVFEWEADGDAIAKSYGLHPSLVLPHGALAAAAGLDDQSVVEEMEAQAKKIAGNRGNQ